MCSIVGFAGEKPAESKKFLNSIIQNNSDATGIFSDKKVGLAQTKISKIEQANSFQQPMFYIPDKGACSKKLNPKNIKQAKLAIVFKGKIYNSKEVKSLLHGKGYTFSTECDAELITASYAEWGTKFLDRLNGEWAFCIYDLENEVLFLSRDRFGVIPMYYYHSEDQFIFSTELRNFYLSGIPKEIDKSSLNHYYLLNTSPGRQSMLKGVKKMQAATNLIYDLKTQNIGITEKYWTNSFSHTINSEEEGKAKILQLLKDSVKKRIDSDIEPGAFLSGNLADSAIIMFMKEFIDKPKTFSIRFDQENNTISDFSKKISDQFNTEHYDFEFTSKDVKELIEKSSEYYCEPIGDPTVIPAFLSSQLAGEHVQVILSGTGSDEVFAGGQRYNDYFQFIKLRNLPKLIRNIACSKYKKQNIDFAGKLKQLVQTKDNKLFYIKLLSNAFRNEEESYYNLDEIEDLYPFFGKDEPINELLSFDQNQYLINNLLFKGYRTSSANSIETRNPFLDHRLVEYTNSLNPILKINNGNRNHILKESLNGLMPDEIINRQEKSVVIPLKQYFRNELKTFTKELIFDNLNNFPEFTNEYVSKIWQLHMDKEYDYSPFFWNLIMLIKWHEKYMK